jgi:hypothetical protein
MPLQIEILRLLQRINRVRDLSAFHSVGRVKIVMIKLQIPESLATVLSRSEMGCHQQYGSADGNESHSLRDRRV